MLKKMVAMCQICLCQISVNNFAVNKQKKSKTSFHATRLNYLNRQGIIVRCTLRMGSTSQCLHCDFVVFLSSMVSSSVWTSLAKV